MPYIPGMKKLILSLAAAAAVLPAQVLAARLQDPQQLRLDQEVQLPAPLEWGGRWATEVGLPGGLAVRFSASASAAWIGSVVHALQRPC